MTTPLEKELKREVDVKGDLFTLTISPDGLKLVPKGKRNGVELRWGDLVSGEAALAAALNASLQTISRFPEPRSRSQIAAKNAGSPKRKPRPSRAKIPRSKRPPQAGRGRRARRAR